MRLIYFPSLCLHGEANQFSLVCLHGEINLFFLVCLHGEVNLFFLVVCMVRLIYFSWCVCMVEVNLFLRTAYNCQREVVSTEAWPHRLTCLFIDAESPCSMGTRGPITSNPVKSTMHLLANRVSSNLKECGYKGAVHIASSVDSLAEWNDT